MNKEAQQVDHPGASPPKNGWQTTIPKRNVGWKKKNLLGIKWPNKKENIKKLTSCYVKFLKYGFLKDGVKNIWDIHLEHHPIKMDV